VNKETDVNPPENRRLWRHSSTARVKSGERGGWKQF